MSLDVTRLGDSVFNYTDYTPARFLHYFQQVRHVLAQRSHLVLEIGPGDHTVTDFLRRKGLEVDTLDLDPELRPTYLQDIRNPLNLSRKYEMVLASEVFEHMPFKWLPVVCSNIRDVLVPHGTFVVSLPYSTVRLFPPRPDYGRVVSCEGRIITGVPLCYLQVLLWPFRVLYRLAVRRWNLKDALEFRPPAYADDEVNVHHWDLGQDFTIRQRVREIFGSQFEIQQERAYPNTNTIFYIMKAR